MLTSFPVYCAPRFEPGFCTEMTIGSVKDTYSKVMQVFKEYKLYDPASDG